MTAPRAAEGRAAIRPHVMPLTVYWEDTDAGGVVYYANYLRFAERARTELLRAMGVNQRALAAETGNVFAVRRVEVEYLAPARLEDALEVVTTVARTRGAYVDMEQVVRRAGETLVRMTVRIVCMNARGRATRLPAEVARGFGELEGACGP